ncbi:regulator of G protein signaling-like domain-containing protein [Ditylenchus destructor]|uniref:Regulator of G protein signaling-like domain-containing protein n=1 Tax=Ditylenchus destructor TaxID=166010 RepID=A0AAD4MS53_9BILA|nr:regulator of G protein signaling-like domain-containing protein [Ditylenchus destructor]
MVPNVFSRRDEAIDLFYLTTDVYPSFPNTKELRRFAYEIFSTFLIPTAPLQVPDISQPLIQQVDKVLRSTAPNSTSQEIASGKSSKGRSFDGTEDFGKNFVSNTGETDALMYWGFGKL